MSSVSTSPRVQKGALVAITPAAPRPTLISFQYNAESLSRTLEPQTAGEGGARSEATRISGAPVETIKLDVEIDATDQLERGDGTAVSMGIHPQLAALSTLLYPPSATVIANTALLAVGTIEIIPPTGPLTFFVWGRNRVLPVRLTEFSITEEAHNVNLNPIRAKVSLGLRVLSYNDLPVMHPGYALFLAQQVMKERMARMTGAGGAGAGEFAGGIPSGGVS